MKRTHLAIGLVAAGLLLVAIGFQFWTPGRASESPGKGAHLAGFFPAALSGVRGRDLQVGSTENVRTAVERTLRYDDILFREYRLKNATVSLYAAYWGPGRMPTQLVASHTPDRCWIENGWVCEQARHEVSTGVTTAAFLPGEWRIFRAPNGQKLNVIFWHLVGREVYDYGDRSNRMPSVWRWWRDVATQAFKAPAEQYFIRVTSDRPFAELKGDPGWEEILESLAKLGLDSKAQGAKR